MGKNVLVLGGNQFLGRAIVRRFLKMGYQVYVLNRGNRPNLEGTIPLIADRNDLNAMKRVCEAIRFDVVFDGSSYTPSQTKFLLESINHDIAHYVHISSASVYIDEESYPYREDSKRGSCSNWGDYSTNKYLCEEILFAAYREYHLPITILRPIYLYGIENNLDRETYVFKRLLTNQPIIVPGFGRSLVQFGFMEDLCDAVEAICKSTISIGKAYNVSGTEYVTLNKWIKTCAKVLGVKGTIIPIEGSIYGRKAREWFPFRDVTLIGDCSLIEQELGVRPKYTLEEGLRKIAESIDLTKLIEDFQVSEVEQELLDKIGKGTFSQWD